MNSSDPKHEKTYQLSWSVRTGRWLRSRREIISLVFMGLVAAGSVTAFIVGNPGLGAGLGVVGALFLLYAYTSWFNGMN